MTTTAINERLTKKGYRREMQVVLSACFFIRRAVSC